MPTMHRSVKPQIYLWSAAIAMCWSVSAHAYGAKAHRIVGHIADRYVCVETRQAIVPLMGDYSLAGAGLWADKIRSNKKWDVARPWHYMNVPDDVTIADRRIAAGGDVLVAIERFRAELADPELSVEQHEIALRFLVHLVADIHQPLHVGRREDLGGNRIKVTVGAKKLNLHAFWDSFALEQAGGEPYAYAARLANRDFRSVAQWGASEPLMWAEESKLFRPEVYAFERDPVTGAGVLGPTYRAGALEIIDLRLSQAGVRLAAILNGIYCPAKVSERPESNGLSH
jgi:hypothetical protein